MSEQQARSKPSAPQALPQTRENLWLLTFGPAMWAVHLLLSYVTAAIWCAKATPQGPLGGVRGAIGVYTALALAGIVATAWRAYRRHRLGHSPAPYDQDTAADRHRFLGFATLLLCGLSFVATLFVALPILFIRSCA